MIWPVVLKAMRQEVVEVLLNVKADSRSAAESIALAQGRRLLTTKELPAGAHTRHGNWAVLDAIPADVPLPD